MAVTSRDIVSKWLKGLCRYKKDGATITVTTKTNSVKKTFGTRFGMLWTA